MGKVSSNFSEYLSNVWMNDFEIEGTQIVGLLSHEFYGILKQISMIAKNYNSTIEFDNISKGFSRVIENSPSSISTLITNQYNFCYQELYSKIIKDGDYALKGNRYEASNERIKLIENALDRYKNNLDIVYKKMVETFEQQSRTFVVNSVVDDLLKCLEEEFFELPCKQNKNAYNECKKLLDKTEGPIISNLTDICLSHTQRLNDNIASYLEQKIHIEKGNTFSSDELKTAREALVGSSGYRKAS